MLRAMRVIALACLLLFEITPSHASLKALTSRGNFNLQCEDEGIIKIASLSSHGKDLDDDKGRCVHDQLYKGIQELCEDTGSSCAFDIEEVTILVDLEDCLLKDELLTVTYTCHKDNKRKKRSGAGDVTDVNKLMSKLQANSVACVKVADLVKSECSKATLTTQGKGFKDNYTLLSKMGKWVEYMKANPNAHTYKEKIDRSNILLKEVDRACKFMSTIRTKCSTRIINKDAGSTAQKTTPGPVDRNTIWQQLNKMAKQIIILRRLAQKKGETSNVKSLRMLLGKISKKKKVPTATLR